MADVFISYAREDRAHAHALAQQAERQGWTVWWDHDLLAGKPYAQVIEEEIRTAKCVVVLWSRHSVTSEWVQNEAREGLRRHLLVPIVVSDDVVPPLEFRHLQVARLGDAEEVMASIRAMIEGSAAPRAEHAPPEKSPRTRIAVVAIVLGLLVAAGAFLLWPRPRPRTFPLDRMATAVGLLELGTGERCTGFLVDSRATVVMTEAPCGRTPATTRFLLDYTGNESDAVPTRVVRRLAMEPGRYALLEVGTVDPKRFRRISLRTRRPVIGEGVIVVHHAGGAPRSKTRCVVANVEAGRFEYDCEHNFAEAGGSPIIAERDHLLLGMHIGRGQAPLRKVAVTIPGIRVDDLLK